MQQQIDTSGGAENQMASDSQQQKEFFKQKVTEYMSKANFRKEIKSMLGKQNQRLNVSIDDLRRSDPDLAKYVTKNPIDAVSMFEGELDRSIKEMLDDSGKGGNSEKTATNTNDKAFPTKTKRYYINFEGNFGRNHVTPRGLKANLVNQLVSVRGIVTRMGLVKPMIQTSVHYCEATKKGEIRHYDDNTNLAEMGAEQNRSTNGAETFPVKDKDGNTLTHEYGYCLYKDSQVVTIQEMPENAPPGQLPRSVQVVLQNDLVDSIKPGDRVEVTGVYRAAPNVHMGVTRGTFRTQIIATGVLSLLAEKQKPSLSEQDIKNIRKLSKDEDVFNVLGASIAPTIEGYPFVKKSILLQLLGGAEKVLENGTHLRGDINIMMVGDPSTAKSQLLRHIMDIAPLAINTTGRGSSGVGLTAAVAVDKDTGDRHLEAGAMVLADRGVVCIDEFDKMNDADRVAIHEVMEQQTVTIAKAGIHCSLNARCSVIAAANPIYSEYARDLAVATNIGLPDSLLSRFDLLFVMLDEKEPEQDRRIAERVITNHRFMNASEAPQINYYNDDTVIERELNIENRQDGKGTTVFEKDLATGVKQGVRIVTREFLKKYISFVRSRKAPELAQDAIGYAAGLYGALRSAAVRADPNKLSVPVTVRTLETLIRLATAHAKLRLANHVECSDLELASKLLHMTIFNEPIVEEQEDDEEMQEDEVARDEGAAQNNNEDDVVPLKQQAGRAARSRKRAENKENGNDNDGEDDNEGPIASKRARIDHTEQVSQLFNAQPSVADDQQKRLVFKMCNFLKDSQNKASTDAVWKRYMGLNERESMRKGTNEPLIGSKEQLIQIMEALEHDNLVMYAAEDNQVILM